jgi:hypothetical protein
MEVPPLRDGTCCGRLVDCTFPCIARRKRLLLLLWVVCAALSGAFALRFISSTTIDQSEPAGTLSAESRAIFRQQFPDAAETNNLIVLLRLRDHDASGSVLGSYARNRTLDLQAAFQAWDKANPGIYQDLSGWYTLVDTPFASEAPAMLSADGKTTIINVDYTYSTCCSDNFVKLLRSTVAQVSSACCNEVAVLIVRVDN